MSNITAFLDEDTIAAINLFFEKTDHEPQRNGCYTLMNDSCGDTKKCAFLRMKAGFIRAGIIGHERV